jgi:hypothetical protein
MSSNLWYHFAFAISQKLLELKCYLDGNMISIGDTARVLIANDVVRPTELVFGSSNTIGGGESNLNGYI